MFCEPETTHYKRIQISVLNTKTFYSEGYNHEEVNLNGESLTFTVQIIET